MLESVSTFSPGQNLPKNWKMAFNTNEELGVAQWSGDPEKIIIGQPIRKPGVEFEKSAFDEK